jgi:hypothetical protein
MQIIGGSAKFTWKKTGLLNGFRNRTAETSSKVYGRTTRTLGSFSRLLRFSRPGGNAESGKFILRQDTQNEIKQNAIGHRRFGNPIEYRKLQDGISRSIRPEKSCSRRDETRNSDG